MLDLGTGDGRLLGLLKIDRPEARGVALDFSPVLLERARERFVGDPLVEVVDHNLDEPLPALGYFDAVVSCFAIHHLTHERKRSL
jgi:ubiquinone/menaquinone biosynthesis C-methylase UbiE